MPPENQWFLRRVTAEDADPLYSLLCVPEVYRYLADGAAPPRSAVNYWIELSETDSSSSDYGLWLLVQADTTLAGCVRMARRDQPRTAELTYLLHPGFWGEGLATRMSWTVIQKAFDGGQIDEIIAGTDKPNTASLAVMQRLGMTYLRDVQYPAGPGVEYSCHRSTVPSTIPQTIPI